MILSDFILFSRRNKILTESGIDSRQLCIDRKHFDAYPYTVEYRYNSRGFRDNEWPDSIEELKNCIWCFGDSFTVGLGSPVEHTWVNILQQKIGIRCINVSMDGASNEWIARKINRVSEEINPRLIIVHWSYFHRTESKNTSLSDEARRIGYSDDISVKYQLDNFINLRGTINNSSTQIIQSIIPDGSPIYTRNQFEKKINDLKGTEWPDLIDITPDEFCSVDKSIKKELTKFGVLDHVIQYIENRYLLDDCIFVEQIDFARDSHHYDYLTAGKFVDSVMERINTFSS